MTRYSFDLTHISPNRFRLTTDTATYVIRLAQTKDDDNQFIGWQTTIRQDGETWEGDAEIFPTSHGALWDAVGTVLDTEEDQRAEREG